MDASLFARRTAASYELLQQSRNGMEHFVKLLTYSVKHPPSFFFMKQITHLCTVLMLTTLGIEMILPGTCHFEFLGGMPP